MSGYLMYIDEEQMPITPGKLQLKIKGKNKTVTLINDGEVNFLKLPGLTEINVSLLLPMFQSYSGHAHNSPDHYLALFETLVVERKPARFILSRETLDSKRLYDTNIQVSLESYTIDEDASNGSDVIVALVFKQFKDFGTKQVRILEPATEADQPVAIIEQPRETHNAPQVSNHTVEAGDTLWLLAKRFYGDGSRYTDIYEANSGILSDPNVIKVGQTLVIPS